MKERIKKTGKFVISKLKFILMFVGVLILGLLIKKVGVAKLIETVGRMSPFYIILATIPWVLTIVFGTYRLKKLVDSDLSFFEIFKIYCYGYLLNYASPVQGFGAGAKIAMLHMKKVRASRSFASVSSEIIYDLIFSSAIIAIFLAYHLNFFLTELTNKVNLKLFFLGVFILLMLLVIAFILRKNKFVTEFFSHLIGTFHLKNMVSLMPLTLAIWFFSALTVYMLFIAADAPISLGLTTASLSIGFVFGIASFIPGGLGVRDAITAYVYSLSGVPLDTTISVAIFFRFFSIGIVLVIALLAAFYGRYKKRRIGN